MIVLIRIAGLVNMKQELEETLFRMRMRKKIYLCYIK